MQLEEMIVAHTNTHTAYLALPEFKSFIMPFLLLDRVASTLPLLWLLTTLNRFRHHLSSVPDKLRLMNILDHDVWLQNRTVTKLIAKCVKIIPFVDCVICELLMYISI